MDDYYFDSSYILLEQHYRTWDPHLCHWSRFDIILDACVYGVHDDILTWMYTNFHDYLMRFLLNVHFNDFFMYFDYLYLVLMMFGRMQYKQWDPGIVWFPFWGKQIVWEVESPFEKMIVIRVVQ